MHQRCHWERAGKTALWNRNYIKNPRKYGKPLPEEAFEVGKEPNMKGKCIELQDMKVAIQTGATNLELIEHHLGCFAKYPWLIGVFLPPFAHNFWWSAG